jgi:hypothetical protein
MSGTGSSTCKNCIKCDYNNSITSFPLDLTAVPSDTLYDAVDEPITMNFQWAAKSISPHFISAGGLIDEGDGSGAANISTLQFHNTTYNIYSVQITAATHNNWIIPVTLKGQNSEDLIITFYNSNTTLPYNYIIIVLPIIRNGTAATDPMYLQGLSNSQAQGTFNLSSCLPSSKSQFAYYATCLDGYTEYEHPENIYVFVAVKGISVSASLMSTLQKLMPGGQTFPPVSLPFLRHFARQITSIGNNEFTKYILSTRHLLDYAGISSIYKDLTINERTDPTSAYKCVPLDPDTDVVNGQIQVDLESSQLLSDVLAERDSVRAASSPIQLTPAGKTRLQTYIGSALGICCAVLIFSILLYFAVTFVSSGQEIPPGGTAASVGTTKPSAWSQQLPLYGLMTVVAGLIGFTIGAVVS